MNSFFSGFNVGQDEIKILLSLVVSFFAGIVISAGYIIGNRKRHFSKNFAVTLVLLPMIIAVVIPFIATDLKKTLSLAGIFALIRFRSVPGDSKDILYVFFCLSVGLIIGVGNYVIALATTLVITLLYILIQKRWNRNEEQVLKVSIPEDMNYKDVFNDIFEKYLSKHSVRAVRTTNMGTLFQISYNIVAKKDADMKSFIDELRTRNGNLNIIIENPDDAEKLVL